MDFFGSETQYHCRPWDVTFRNEFPGSPPDLILDPVEAYSTESALLSFHDAPARHNIHGHAAPWSAMRAPSLPSLHHESMYTHQLPSLTPYDYGDHQASMSSSNSGPPSTDVSSGQSDRHSTPWSSPAPSAAAFSPHMNCFDSHQPSYGGGFSQNELQRIVSMPDIQYSADSLPDQVLFDDDHGYYAVTPDEGYQPRESEMETQSNTTVDATSATLLPVARPESPNVRRRRTSSNRSVTSPNISSKVVKRPNNTRKTSSASASAIIKQEETNETSSTNRAFPCIFAMYGCTSSFDAKNEWKRHISTQHMRTGYWRCDICEKDNKPNDFNRKDLFLQHVRRMHPKHIAESDRTRTSPARSPRKTSCHKDPNVIAERCHHITRSLPTQSGCHFCEQRFWGSKGWDERMEHVGGHIETARKEGRETNDAVDWRRDEDLHEYLMEEGIVVARPGKQWDLAEGAK